MASDKATLPGPGQILLDLVSRRTGYPIAALDLSQDMEADLGIDSIKRVEIFGELQNLGLIQPGVGHEMLGRARTLRDVITHLAAPEPAVSGWGGEVVSYEPGRTFVGRWELSADDPVAQHHTLGGRKVSAIEPSRLGLPVLPFTVMAEILAQAAAVLEPGMEVIAFRNLSANRWVSYRPEGPVWLEVRATRDPSHPSEVTVEIQGDPRRSARGPEVVFNGVVVFAGSRPAPPEPFPVRPEPGRTCRLSAGELYRDQWLFHGPALRAMSRAGSSTPDGIEGTLTVLPRRDLLPERLWPRLHSDPIVLDAFTHLLGAWGIDRQAGDEGDVMFPLRVSEITFHGPNPVEGSELDCRISVHEVSRHRVRVRADILTTDGRVWAAVRDWEDWRFYWPDRYRDVFRAPDTVLLGEPIGTSGGPPGLVLVWLEPPADMGKPVWRDVLEWVQLSGAERTSSRAASRSEGDLTKSLWKAIACKDAARRVWLDDGCPPVYPADLALDRGPDGRTSVRFPGPAGPSIAPVVAAASTGGVALAAASADPRARLGVAVEEIFTTLHETRGEPAGAAELEPLGVAGPEWLARLRAVRSAATGALGYAGFDEGRGVGIIEVDPSTETAVATAVTPGGPVRLLVRCGIRGGHAWAWTSLGES